MSKANWWCLIPSDFAEKADLTNLQVVRQAVESYNLLRSYKNPASPGGLGAYLSGMSLFALPF